MKLLPVAIPTAEEFGAASEAICQRCRTAFYRGSEAAERDWLNHLTAHVAGHLAQEVALIDAPLLPANAALLVRRRADGPQEILAVAEALVRGILRDLEEDLDPVRCVAEGRLAVAAEAILGASRLL